MLLAVLVLPACATGSKQADEGEVNTKLTISVQSDPLGFIEDAISGFKEIHPDVDIELSNYRADYQKYREQAGAQLMAGQGDDLLSFLGFNDQKYFDSGLMADFYPIMQNDPEFNEADYFMNVFEGFSYKNKLLIFPIFYTYWEISVNESLAPGLAEKFKQYDKITLREVFELYNGPENNGKYYISESLDALTALDRYINTYVDFEKKECYFNTPEFIKFITDAKNATDPQKIADGYLGYTFGGSYFDEEKENRLASKYLFWDDGSMVETYLLPVDLQGGFVHRIPLVTDDGKLIAGAMDAFFINEASKNKELAWEFVKYLSSTKAMWFSSCIPVHRQLFDSYYMKIEIPRAIKDLQQRFGEFEPQKTNEEIMASLTAIGEMPLEHAIYLRFEVIKEIMQSFYDGVYTAEQAASELQNKVSLYLKE
jgi:ABC-type glycerol-3-phosphate transport system substrate-binding protein